MAKYSVKHLVFNIAARLSNVIYSYLSIEKEYSCYKNFPFHIKAAF